MKDSTSDQQEKRKLLLNEVAFYHERLAKHPIASYCNDAALPPDVLEEFVRIQYVDSTLWVAMLSLAKGKVSSAKLGEAIRKNILCETGCDGIPHVTLCKQFVESMGLEAQFGDYREYAPATAHSVEVMNAFDCASDGLIAGWLLVAESLVPTLFSLFRPAFANQKTADLRYLDEHITVDADEHAQWMTEAALEISNSESGFRDILEGINLGGRATLSVPDALFAKTVRMQASQKMRRSA